MLSVPVAALCCTGSRAFTIMIVPVYSVTAAVRSIGYPVKHGDVADRQQLPLFVAIDGATPAPCATRLLHGHNIAGRPRHRGADTFQSAVCDENAGSRHRFRRRV